MDNMDKVVKQITKTNFIENLEKKYPLIGITSTTRLLPDSQPTTTTTPQEKHRRDCSALAPYPTDGFSVFWILFTFTKPHAHQSVLLTLVSNQRYQYHYDYCKL